MIKCLYFGSKVRGNWLNLSSIIVSLQKEASPAIGMHRSKSKHELKLLEKIPENAEATVVLVGE